MAPSFTLIVPDLFLSVRIARDAGNSPPRLDGLEALMARADVREASEALSGLVTELLPTRNLDGKRPAAGPVGFYADMDYPPAGWCYRADPVSLQAHTDHLRLLDSRYVQPEPDEAQALMAAFNEAYEKDGLSLCATRPSRWYLLMGTHLDVTTFEPGSALGRNVIDFMPVGRDSAQLKSLMTEVQMLFHQHEVNKSREQRGLTLINSIWIWGGGQLPALRPCPLPAAWSSDSDAYLRGLWALSGNECAPLPRDAKACLAAIGAPGGVALLGGVADAWIEGGAERWLQRLLALDREWCQPVVSALKGGRLNGARLLTNGFEFVLSRRASRRFWRRRKPLSDWCS